jgi:hypothetical protein
LLGSELTVESKLGEGSTFSFTLPPARSRNRRGVILSGRVTLIAVAR